MNEKWDRRFLELAAHIATWSKDRSTKVGAVIVGTALREIRGTGYNGFPRGVNDDEDSRHERPMKYFMTEHAERNAVFFAAHNGTSTAGCTMYVTAFPCADCARAIISAGIKRVVTRASGGVSMPERWAESWRAARTMFTEAGIEVVEYL